MTKQHSNSTNTGSNTAMRNAFIAALPVSQRHQGNVVARAIRSNAGTRTKFMAR